MRDGKPAELSAFHEGDRLSAVIITSKPPHVMTEKEVQATLAAAPAPAAAAAAPVAAARTPAATPAPAPRAAAAPAPAPAAAPPSASASAAPAPAVSAQGQAETLPHTASPWPLLWSATLLTLIVGLALSIRRRLVG